MCMIGNVEIDNIMEIPELPVSPESTEVICLNFDAADDSGRWWGVYRIEDKLYRGKPCTFTKGKIPEHYCIK